MRPATYVKCMKCNADLTMKGKKRRRCAGCHSIFYDDVACQKEDWAIHKTECKELQRCFIATVRPDYPKIDTMAKLIACPDACRIISMSYFHGVGGFEKNYGVGLFWTLQWMKGGDVDAILSLGLTYTADASHTGGAIPNKCEEGVKLLLRGCAIKDHPDAQYRLAFCYETGKGVKANPQEAAKWTRRAAEGGDLNAQVQLGFNLRFGTGVKKDLEEALIWTRKAAERGNEGAQFNLGLLIMKEFEVGVGPKEAKEAVGWFRKAAEQGNVEAQCLMGDFLMDGTGVDGVRYPAEAVSWFRKAVDQGHARAQYNLGELYFSGDAGVDRDFHEGVRLFRLSAAQGYDKAKDLLDKVNSVRSGGVC